MNISVYIPSYNQKKYLSEAIESVLAQTLSPSQIIVADDASSDGSQEMIRGYANRYPHLFTTIFHESNQGVTRTRLDALHAVTGDYITYVDGDDRLISTKLDLEINALQQHPNCDIAFSNNHYINEKGERLGTWLENEHLPPVGDVFIPTFARAYPKKNLFRMEMVVYQKWRDIGFHDPKLNLYEDWDMRIRLTKHLKTVYINQPLSEIRLHRKGLSSATSLKHLQATQYIYNKNKYLLRNCSREKKLWVWVQLAQWKSKNIRRAARLMTTDFQKLSLQQKTTMWKYYAQGCQYAPWDISPKLAIQILKATLR